LIAKNNTFAEKAFAGEIYDDFVSSFGKAAMSMGHKRITGMVFSVLFLSEDPLSLDDITQELETSKATICGTVKELLKLGFIQKAWVKGSRKDYYMAEKSVNVLIQKALQSMLDTRLATTHAFVDRIQKKIVQMKEMGVVDDRLDYFHSKIQEIYQLNNCLTKLIIQFDNPC
jgi:DNA-binding transcriptional regulator GbsR (MarR family)